MGYLMGDYLGEVQRLLTGGEEAEFLATHPLTAARVAAFEAAVSVLGFDQIYTPPEWYQFEVPIIPPSGLCVSDSTFGNVLVAPNAQGSLFYNAFVDDAHCAAAEKVLSDGEYSSPTTPPDANPCDWLCQLQKDVNIAWLVFLGVAGLYAYNTFRKR